MTFSISSAITFNKNRNFSQQAIGLIQIYTNTNSSGKIDSPTVTAIYNWQKSPNRRAKLDADGKMGALSLGVMILELEETGRYADASVLRKFPFNLPTGGGGEKAGSINPVDSFVHTTNTPLELRKIGNQWEMMGSFLVTVKLNPLLEDQTRYEYRQYIKGKASTQLGRWEMGSPWAFIQDEVSAANRFKVPGGLDEFNWKEDGEVMGVDKVEKFGYRASPPVNRHEPGTQWKLKDLYVPHPLGFDYILEDSFGLRGDYKSALRIILDLHYRGVVIEKLEGGGEKEIISKTWSYQKIGTTK